MDKIFGERHIDANAPRWLGANEGHFFAWLCGLSVPIEMIGGSSVELWKTEGLWIIIRGLDVVCSACYVSLMVQQTQNGQSIVGGQLV